MKYDVASRGDDTSNSIADKIRKGLDSFGFTLDEARPEIVISVGGDGTLLEAFHRHKHRLEDTCFVGVHTGHLGFYADWIPQEVDKLIIHIAKTPYQVVEYPLLEIVVRYHKEGEFDRYLALNESTIKATEGSLVCNVDIKGELFETFRGDGLCISTPSGSTAYNKALGGAILHPSLASLQIAEMASINNRVYRTIGSPLVLPEHHTCLLKPLNNVGMQITIDHHTIVNNDLQSLQYRVADESIRFARFRPFTFWKRVKESFVGD